MSGYGETLTSSLEAQGQQEEEEMYFTVFSCFYAGNGDPPAPAKSGAHRGPGSSGRESCRKGDRTQFFVFVRVLSKNVLQDLVPLFSARSNTRTVLSASLEHERSAGVCSTFL